MGTKITLTLNLEEVWGISTDIKKKGGADV